MVPRIGLAAGLIVVLIAFVSGTRQRSDRETPFRPRPARVAAEATDGAAALVPNRIGAAAIGTYELRVTVAGKGIKTGGGVLVGLPKAWFVNPYPIPKLLQTVDRMRPHHLSVRSSRAGTAFDVAVDTVGFTGKIERFNQTIAAINTGASLEAGDTVSFVLANTTAPYISGANEVQIAIDADGRKRFVPIRRGAPYDIIPAVAEQFTLVGPTEAVVARPVTLQITAFDRFANVAVGFSGSGEIVGIEPRRKVVFQPNDRGRVTFTWTPMKEGFYFPEASLQSAATSALVSTKGNPIRVFANEPQIKTYWGELHSHSSISADGIGNDLFTYARDSAHLDFFASTEHADDDGIQPPRPGSTAPRPEWGNAIRPEDWDAIKARVERFNEPNRFVTLLAYECSLRAPYGHHNVFFRSTDGEPWPVGLVGSVETLWSKIAAGDAITIPHHTGIAFVGAPSGAESAGPELQPIITATNVAAPSPGFSVDWTHHDPVMRPLLEIYSLHGSSERYDPEDSLAYENAGFTFARSVPGAHYARDAWAAGLQLGVVAASDDHSARPGQPNGGVTAIRAARLTRDSVFGALTRKETYGTTGQRIYMDLEIAGINMGQSGRVRGPVAGNITIAAPSEIAIAELLRREMPSGDYLVAHQWHDVGRLLQTRFTDAPANNRLMYYLRVQLRERVRGRVVRGWTSPVWLAGDTTP